MKRLLVYLKSYTKESILAPLFKMLEAIFELIVPLVIASIVDKGIKTGSTQYVVTMVAILIGLGIVGFACSVVAQYFAAVAAVGFGTKLRHALFEHLLGLSFDEVDKIGTGTMITRMTSDANMVQRGVNMVLRLFLRSPFVVFGAMIMAFTINARISLIFLVTIILLGATVITITLVNIPMLKEVQRRLDRVLIATRENLSGVRVIRAFCKEDSEIQSFDDRTLTLRKQQIKSGNLASLMNPLTYIIINLGIALLIWRGAINVNVGNLTQGQVIALYNYMSQILVELVKLVNLIIIMNKALASANRIEGIFEMQSNMSTNENAPVPADDDTIIEFKDVSLAYNKDSSPAISNASFKVKRGDVVGIIGGTGSGKSTLVHLISRFYDATSGEVLYDGVNIKDVPLVALRERIGIVMQKAILFSGTIADNLRWGKADATDEELKEAIANAQASAINIQVDSETKKQATDILNAKGGLDAQIEERGKNLSGGQKQRFSIARALIKKPEILILDDSTSALDYATDAALRKTIAELDYKPTTFIVSQRASSIQNADLIIVLDDGNIVGQGTNDELLKNCEVYREIYETQFKKEGAN